MCLNIFVPNLFFKSHFKMFCDANNLIYKKRSKVDDFLLNETNINGMLKRIEGIVLRLHHKEDYFKNKHNPEKVLNILSDKKKWLSFFVYELVTLERSREELKIRDYPEPIVFTIWKRDLPFIEPVFLSYYLIPYIIRYQIKKIQEDELLRKFAETRFAIVPQPSFKYKPKMIYAKHYYSHYEDGFGCHLALISVPGFDYFVKEEEGDESQTIVTFDQPIDKNRIFEYYFIGWRCSDTRKHSYFIINDPKRKVFLISTFRAKHFVPIDRSKSFYAETHDEFAELVKNSEQSLMGCLNIIKFLVDERDKKYVDEVIQLLETY